MPDPVRDAIGKALFHAQIGGKSPRAKPFHGCGGGGGVLEIVDDFDGDTYRAVYTVRFAEAVYVLHVFQKKSPRGTSTPRQDVELIRRRLREAEEDYRERYARKGGSSDGNQR